MLRFVADADDAVEGERARALAKERERRLVERAQAGDRAAVGELLTQYGPGLYRSVLLPRLGSEAAAKDALAETYAKVVERLGQFQWQNVGFYPWLRMVALRIALDHLRARKRLVLWDAEDVEREMDETDASAPLDQRLEERRETEAARAKVAAALDAIHPRYARAIRLRVLEERPREEVAETLGVTPATFDVLLHRAIAALKKGLIEATPREPGATPPRRARQATTRTTETRTRATEVGDDDA
jgi:RNA polymerase sigma-70 factor (ECF subfamily)